MNANILNSKPVTNHSKQEETMRTWKRSIPGITAILAAVFILALASLALGGLRSSRRARVSYPPVYDATGAMLASVQFPKYPDVARPRNTVYDATGAMLKAVVFPSDVKPTQAVAPVYDATGAMLAAVPFPKYPDIARPRVTIYDATGAMLAAVPFPKYPDIARPRVTVYDATGAMLEAVVYPKYPDAPVAIAAAPQPARQLPASSSPWLSLSLAGIAALASGIAIWQTNRQRRCIPG